MAGAEKSISGFNASASRIGGALTRSLTLPLLALGGVALKLASDYDSAIGRVAGLTTVLDSGKHTIGEVSNDLLKLSQIVPTAPTELANAFYFAGSAGLGFAQAMDVVTLSAKGAAIGMGNAADISKILIFAINAFKGTGLTAAHAMDVLTAGIKAGTAEPNDMAIALGRLLPIAREAGVTFDDVVASVAALTNIGLPTRVATTSLRALFSELLAPTQAATDKLDQLGISAKQLRNTFKLGPVAAFNLLTKATHGNVDALHDILPQIRGFTAFLGLSGARLKAYKHVIDEVTHSTGTLDKAFKIIGKTPQFQFEVGLNKLRVAGIKLGNTLVPVFLRVIGVIGSFGDLLSSMPGWARVATVAIGLIAASAGPLLKLYGALIADGAGLFSSFKSTATGLTLMAVAAAFAVGGFSSMAKGSITLMSTLATLAGTFGAVFLGLRGLQAGLAGLGVDFGLSGGEIGLIAIAVAGLVTVFAEGIAEEHAMANAAKQVSDSFTQAANAGDRLGKAIAGIKDPGIRNTLEQLAKTMGLLNQPTGKALPTLLQGVTVNAAKAEGAISQIDLSKVFNSADIGVLTKLQTALHNSATTGATFSKSLKDVGLSVTQVNDVIQRLNSASRASTSPISPGGGKASGLALNKVSAGAANSASQLQNLVAALEGGSTAYKGFQTETRAAILASRLNDQATQQLADHFGVSKDVITGALADIGTSAANVAGSGGGAIKAFGQQAFGGFGKAAAEAKVAADEMNALNATLTQTLSGSFGLFDKFDSKVKGSTDKLVKHAQAVAQVSLKEVEQAQSLAARGVPGDLLSELVSKGPSMVAKFAGASNKQLGKLVTAYEIRLGAIDSAILKEGDHQKGKGKDMVSGFVEAILSSKGITTNAGHQIVNSVAQGLQSGKLSQKTLPLILNFTRTIEGSGLPAKAGSALTANFVQGVAAGKVNLTSKGIQFIQSFAAGLKNTNIPRAAANAAVTAAVNQLQKAKGALPAGKKSIAQFAHGIASGKGIAQNQASNVTRVVKNALDKGKQPAGRAGKEMGSSFAKGVGSQKGAAATGGAQVANAAKNKLAAAKAGAFADGSAVGSQFAAGISSQQAAAAAAAAALAASAKAALAKASKGSPKYFTWYMGQDIAEQYHQGMKNKGLDLRRGQHSVTISHRPAGGRKQSRLVLIEGAVKVDGMDARMRGVAREEAVGELTYRGL
jgi:TP901 family phage tail tape measure protein